MAATRLADSVEHDISNLPPVQYAVSKNDLRSSVLSRVAASYALESMFAAGATSIDQPVAFAPEEWRTFVQVLQTCDPQTYADHPQVRQAATVLIDDTPHSALAKLLTVHMPGADTVQGHWSNYWCGGEVIDHQLKQGVQTILNAHPRLDAALVKTVVNELRYGVA